MAQTKEIRKKIGSVQNTMKITSAMELVASSKMKKTQDAMKKGKPYTKLKSSNFDHFCRIQCDDFHFRTNSGI